MSRDALPCIACGQQLKNIDDTAGNQPYNGTAFETHGHYGSTIFDPMDGHYLEINVCDACLALHRDRVMIGRDRRPVMEDGAVAGWEKVRWRLVPWTPEKREIDYALEVALKERGVDDDEELREAAEQEQSAAPAEDKAYRTASGRVLTDAEIQALADEAEQGYEIEKLTPLTEERLQELRRHVRESRGGR